MNASDVFKKGGIADPRQLGFLLVGRQARIVILGLFVEGSQVSLGLIGDRGLGGKLFHQMGRLGTGVFALPAAARTEIHDQFVDAESFLVKENFGTKPERTIELIVRIFRIRRNVDAEFLDQSFCYCTVGRWAFNGEGPSKAQAKRTPHAELVALGVAAKVVVIVKDQNAGIASRCLAIVMRGGETADAASDNNEIEDFACIFGLSGRIPERTVAETVSCLK